MESQTRWPLFVLMLIGFAHALGLAMILVEPMSLFDGRPYLDQDWGLHHTHLRAVEAFWANGGHLWGYSPLYMAGFASNTHLDLSIKAFELAALWTPGLDTILAFKLWVFVGTASIPWLGFGAVRAFVGRVAGARELAALAAVLLTASWWSSFGREMYFYGMLGWPIGCALALLVLALFDRILESQRRISWLHVAWLTACALLLAVHLQASIMLPLPGLALVWLHRRRTDPVVYAWAIGGVVFALLVNAFWLIPLFSHFDENAAHGVGSIPVFVSPDAWTFIKDYVTPNNYWSFRETSVEKLFRLVLLVLGLLGLVRAYRAGRVAVACALGVLVASLFLITYFGSLHDRLQLLQPLRFKLPLDFSLAICAAFAFEGWPSMTSRRRAALAAGVGIGLMASSLGVWQTESRGIMRIQVEPQAPLPALVEWLRTQAPHEGRVLFEESGDETGFVYGGIYLSSFIPAWTGHQLIGGPINVLLVRNAFAELHSGRLFGRDPRSYSDAELADYLELYNIGTLVAFHPVTIQRFMQLEDLVEPVRRFGRHIGVFRVKQTLDWFLEGEGRVEASLGVIRCRDVRASPETGAVTLKYHWIEGLRSDPPRALEPVFRLDDPGPFIRVIDPPSDFDLSIGP